MTKGEKLENIFPKTDEKFSEINGYACKLWDFVSEHQNATSRIDEWKKWKDMIQDIFDEGFKAGQENVLSKMKICDIDNCENPAILRVCQEHTFEAGQEHGCSILSKEGMADGKDFAEKPLADEDAIRWNTWLDMERNWGLNHSGINSHQLCIERMIEKASELSRQKVLDEVEKISLEIMQKVDNANQVITDSEGTICPSRGEMIEWDSQQKILKRISSFLQGDEK